MRPAPFVYHAPRELEAAIALLAAHGDDAKVLAGGQSLVPMLALRLASPAHLVDLGGIPTLSGLTFGDGVRIAAGITQRTLERSAPLARACPLLAEALPYIAHPPIRTRGTVCGSLAHADPAAELPAVMLALGATMSLQGPNGVRDVAAEDFFTSYLDTVLDVDEVLVSVDVPPWPPGAGWAFTEISRRSGDFAIAGVAVLITVANGVVRDARLACCGVASTPVRLRDGEAMLRGRSLDAATIEEVSSAAIVDLDPPSDVHAPSAYRRHVTGVLLRRALTTAAARGGAAVSPQHPQPRHDVSLTRHDVSLTRHDVSLTLNGATRSASCEARATLAEFVRDDLRATGTHVGCEHGVCGACTVLLDGEPVRSCLIFAVQCAGRSVDTIEGLGTPSELHPVQQAFLEAMSFQCGYCTPGIVMTTVAFLAERTDESPPSDDEIREMLSANLCRCTGYQSIVDGVRRAALAWPGKPADRRAT